MHISTIFPQNFPSERKFLFPKLFYVNSRIRHIHLLVQANPPKACVKRTAFQPLFSSKSISSYAVDYHLSSSGFFVTMGQNSLPGNDNALINPLLHLITLAIYI